MWSSVANREYARRYYPAKASKRRKAAATVTVPNGNHNKNADENLPVSLWWRGHAHLLMHVSHATRYDLPFCVDETAGEAGTPTAVVDYAQSNNGKLRALVACLFGCMNHMDKKRSGHEKEKLFLFVNGRGWRRDGMYSCTSPAHST